MSAFLLKLLAIGSMVIDHVGVLFFPEEIGFRVAGRLAMPIMCFFLAEGLRHTRNVRNYLGRLLVFALLTEPLYDRVFFGSWLYPFQQNVFFTLFLALLALALFERYRSGMGGFWVLLLGAAAQLLCTDYGFYGVILAAAFYLLGTGWKSTLLALVLVNLFFPMGGVQLCSVLAAIPLGLYDGRKGPDHRWLFYGFYPLHILVLGALSLLPVQ